MNIGRLVWSLSSARCAAEARLRIDVIILIRSIPYKMMFYQALGINKILIIMHLISIGNKVLIVIHAELHDLSEREHIITLLPCTNQIIHWDKPNQIRGIKTRKITSYL